MGVLQHIPAVIGQEGGVHPGQEKPHADMGRTCKLTCCEATQTNTPPCHPPIYTYLIYYYIYITLVKTKIYYIHFAKTCHVQGRDTTKYTNFSYTESSRKYMGIACSKKLAYTAGKNLFRKYTYFMCTSQKLFPESDPRPSTYSHICTTTCKTHTV